MEELFKKLRELGYCEKFPDDFASCISSAHLICMYYKDSGYLDGCDLVDNVDKVALSKFYKPKMITEIFEWPECSGSGICDMVIVPKHRYTSTACSG